MSKHILVKIAGWTALLAVTILLVNSPKLYYHRLTGRWSERAVVCGQESPYAREETLPDIAFHLEYWTGQQVALSGRLDYLRPEQTFFLRDGIFTAPLDVSGCQHAGDFMAGGVPVLIKGTVAEKGGLPLIEVTDLRETAPDFIRALVDAGTWFSFPFFILAALGLIRLLARPAAWMMKRLGWTRNAKPAPTPEKQADRAAVWFLIAGALGAPFIWLLNPLVGAAYQFYCLIRFRKGLRSTRKWLVAAAVTLFAVGFAGMALVSLGLGTFEKPLSDTYSSWYADARAKADGSERLEFQPYVSKKFYFSIHLPKGWTVDENGDADAPGFPVFKGPESGMVQGKPFVPEMGTQFVPVQGSDIKTLDDAVKLVTDSITGESGAKILGKSHRLLAGGRLETVMLEASKTKDGAEQRALLLMALKNGVFYALGAKAMPAEKWDAYAQVIRDSLGTAEIYPDNFAACLRLNGAVLYGSRSDKEYTYQQRELFGDDAGDLRFVECLTIDGKNSLPICADKNFKDYPQWKFADGTWVAGVQTLQYLSEKTGCALPSSQ